MLNLRRTAAPAELPVTVDEVREHCRVDHYDDDLQLEAALLAAVDHLDGWFGILGRCLVTQTWAFEVDRLCAPVRLPFPDVTDAAIITDGGPVPVGAIEVVNDALGGLVRPVDGATWPDGRATVQFTCGYGDPADVPRAICFAIMLLAAHYYEHREAVVIGPAANELPLGVDRLVRPHTRVKL